jgi:hypothetical protein
LYLSTASRTLWRKHSLFSKFARNFYLTIHRTVNTTDVQNHVDVGSLTAEVDNTHVIVEIMSMFMLRESL